MSSDDFIGQKIKIIGEDDQDVFKELVGPLGDMVKKGETSREVKVPSDGNWFSVSFDAVETKKDRLVISAKRIKNGLVPTSYDPMDKQYIVEFEGTRAAYLRGFHKYRHPIGSWPYIWWDIRAYTNHPRKPEQRVYVKTFRAHDEIRKLILSMEKYYGTSNVVNSYINDNLLRFQTGIMAKKAPEQIEKEWSRGMMESLGYHFVEASDSGYPKGSWRGVDSHWCKNENDLLGKNT